MKKSILVSLSFLLILGFGISVSPTQPANAAGEPYDVYPGDSIQAAIDATLADGGGTIYFAPGVYEEYCLHIGPSEDYGCDIERLELIGCGSSLEDLVAWYLGEAVSGSVLKASFCIDSADYDVLVQGFGLFNWNALNPGGHCSCQEEYASDGDRDGALVVRNSSPTISDCIISHGGTISHSGAGMFNKNSSPIVLNTVFIFCAPAKEYYKTQGGAMTNIYSSPVIINSMFLYNKAPLVKPDLSYGGAIFNDHSNPVLINCVLYGNMAYRPELWGGGSAIYSKGGSSTTLINCISWNNYDIYKEWNNVFVGVEGSDFIFSYCDAESLYDGSGNISSDPMFGYALLFEDMTSLDDILLLDFHLKPGSPCIDTGNPDTTGLPETDIAGLSRILDGNGDGTAIVDMGAYEFVLEAATVDIDPDTLNTKSKGKWITAYIGLPAGYDVKDIKNVKLHYNDSALEANRQDVQGSVFMAKFMRASVIEMLNGATGNIELKVTWTVNGTQFEGFDTIRVINKGK